MGEARTYLFGGEEVALTVRPHPVVLAKPGTPFLAGVALLAGFPNRLTMIIFAIVSARSAWEAAYWWSDRYVLTTNRILSTSGILTKKVASMPLAKITDLTYTRSIGGRILGYGSLHFESAGQQQGLERVDFLPDPDRFYRTVMSLALGPPATKHHEPQTGPGDSTNSEGRISVTDEAAPQSPGPQSAGDDDVVDVRQRYETGDVPVIWTSDD